MVDEKVYVMEDGREYILSSRTKIGDKRYLMLYDEKNDDAFVAYEDNGFLKRIDDSYPEYKNIFELLISKIDDN